MQPNQVVSRDEWLKARREILKREKAHSRRRDEITAARQKMPWVKVEKEYTFEGPDGRVTLAELFGDKDQLVVYHFMFDGAWEAGCGTCSFLVDHVDPATVHLAERDVAFVYVSMAPFAKLEAYRKRMGWKTPWLSSAGSDFNRDFHVSFTEEEIDDGKGLYNFTEDHSFPVKEAPGISVFARDDDGNVYHTYGVFSRGLEDYMTAYNVLDLVPRGRNETRGATWLRRKDEYGEDDG